MKIQLTKQVPVILTIIIIFLLKFIVDILEIIIGSSDWDYYIKSFSSNMFNRVTVLELLVVGPSH